MHMSKFTTGVLLLRLRTPDCKLSGSEHDAPAHNRRPGSHGGPVSGGPAWPGVPGVCVGPGGRDRERRPDGSWSRSRSRSRSGSGSGGGGAGPTRGQVSGWAQGRSRSFLCGPRSRPGAAGTLGRGLRSDPEEIPHQERSGRPDRRIVLSCAAPTATHATRQLRAGDGRDAAGEHFQLCKLLESCPIFPGRLSLLDVMSYEEGKELRTWEEELTWAALQQKNLEELLQHKEQELAEWEIDILEWELNIILHQLCQEKP
ncbi:uncharacterized protein LOC143664751 [Tamandua tetradactyla]|uniref:uncharacterized protein LOC143664751 n=1 Tax=Tamandua tetradactyla TaxID=48850 RepID=UPI0040540013